MTWTFQPLGLCLTPKVRIAPSAITNKLAANLITNGIPTDHGAANTCIRQRTARERCRCRTDISSSRRGRLRPHTGSGGRTKEQIYEEARRKNIKGRSSMNKAQLERASAAEPRRRWPRSAVVRSPNSRAG